MMNDQDDERYRATVRQMMESQAYRELAAAQMFGYGLQFVPELRWLKFMTWHIREEMEHYEVVVKMCRTGQHDEVKQRMFEKWLRQGLLSFGRPGTEGAKYAVGVGLKKRDAAQVMQDFLDDIKPAVKACGLRFLQLSNIGIEAPAL